MVQSDTYLDIFWAWNFNCFFQRCRLHINFVIQGVSVAKSVFPWRWVLPGHVFNIEINLVQSGAQKRLFAKKCGCTYVCLFSWTNESFPETGLHFSLKSTKFLRNDTPARRLRPKKKKCWFRVTRPTLFFPADPKTFYSFLGGGNKKKEKKAHFANPTKTKGK